MGSCLVQPGNASLLLPPILRELGLALALSLGRGNDPLNVVETIGRLRTTLSTWWRIRKEACSRTILIQMNNHIFMRI